MTKVQVPMPTRFLADLYAELQPDSWRSQVGFTTEIELPLKEMLMPEQKDEDVTRILSDWLASYQPCLFGKIAARRGLIEYCVLREIDVLASDDAVQQKIKAARLRWWRRAWQGDASAFIIVVLSEKLAYALPSPAVQEIARRICSLYLEREVQLDRVYLDDVFLEVPDRNRTAWKWAAGINYFTAQADKRWWQDHRIPAGIAFSINSVGHMVKSKRLDNAMQDLQKLTGLDNIDLEHHRVDSLEKALEMAMRTIDKASDACSGKATSLLPRGMDVHLPACPIRLAAPIEHKNHCEYQGWYHTDVTLPREYFFADVQRPSSISGHRLDFTYLFDNSLDNPDHHLMGPGLQIRANEPRNPITDISIHQNDKRLRGIENEVEIDSEPFLREALGL